MGGRLSGFVRLRRLVVVGRGRGVGRGHVCSLVAGRERRGKRACAAQLLLLAILRSRRVGEGSVLRGGCLCLVVVEPRIYVCEC